MKRMKMLGTMLIAMLALAAALGVTSAAAAEIPLPDVHALPTTEPVIAEGSVTKGAIALETALGSKLTAKEFKATVEIKGLQSLGTFHVLFIAVEEPVSKEKCKTEDEKEAGRVGVLGTWHIVYTSLKPLEAGILLLFPQVVMNCGKAKIKIDGTDPKEEAKSRHIILRLLAANMVALKEFGLDTHCVGKGKQELTTWFDEKEVAHEKTLLLANFGAGFENVCEEVAEETKLKVGEKQSVEFLY